MAKYYSDLGYSFKETLNAHVRSLGKDPDMIWSAAYDTIRAVYKAKQERNIFYDFKTNAFKTLSISAKKVALGLVNYIPAVSYHLCMALPAVFTQPGPCLLVTQVAFLQYNCRRTL